MLAQRLFVLLPVLTATVTFAEPQKSGGGAPPGLNGVYQVIPDGQALPGGLRNTGSPMEIALLSAARQRVKSVDLTGDPATLCQPLGPFRMMAQPHTKIELVPGPGSLVVLFEDIAHGQMRTIHFNRSHPRDAEPTWLGDSVGRWEGSTLVVDTVGFNDRTWLNGAGASHSEALHLIERIRPVVGGTYLAYTVTAEDPQVLAQPYTYTRYYQKLETEIQEDICEY